MIRRRKALGGGDIRPAMRAEQADGRVADGRQNAADLPGMAPILPLDHIPHPVHTILDRPVAPLVDQDGAGSRRVGIETGDERDGFVAPPPTWPPLLLAAQPPNLTDLLPAPFLGQIGLQVPRRDQPQLTDFLPPVGFVDRPRVGSAPAGGGKPLRLAPSHRARP